MSSAKTTFIIAYGRHYLAIIHLNDHPTRVKNKLRISMEVLLSNFNPAIVCSFSISCPCFSYSKVPKPPNLTNSRGLSRKKLSPENFYSRIKIFSNCAKNFCPTLKIFVRLARPCLKHFPWHFSAAKCFSYCFTHTPKMISDFFLAT